MNENLNLVEILKDCPEGTELYSTIFGEVKLDYVEIDSEYPIYVKTKDGLSESFTSRGELYSDYNGECTLFPSREQRDWSKFIPKKPKFDPKTFQPFDKVLVRDNESSRWRCTFYSYEREGAKTPYKYITTDDIYVYCIPYNEETKHLVGTNEEAPEYYKYWED